MTTLTEEGHYLTDDLVRNEKVLDEDDVYDEDNMTGWVKWTPDPVDADPCKYKFIKIFNFHYDLVFLF